MKPASVRRLERARALRYWPASMIHDCETMGRPARPDEIVAPVVFETIREELLDAPGPLQPYMAWIVGRPAFRDAVVEAARELRERKLSEIVDRVRTNVRVAFNPSDPTGQTDIPEIEGLLWGYDFDAMVWSEVRALLDQGAPR